MRLLHCTGTCERGRVAGGEVLRTEYKALCWAFYSFIDHLASPMLQALVNIGGLPVMEYRAAYETLFGQQLELAPDGTTLVSHMMVRAPHQKPLTAPAVER